MWALLPLAMIILLIIALYLLFKKPKQEEEPNISQYIVGIYNCLAIIAFYVICKIFIAALKLTLLAYTGYKLNDIINNLIKNI